MRRLTLTIALLLGTIGIALAQAPAAEDHSAHHPTQGTDPSVQSPSAQSSGGAMGPQMRGMMPGMMQGMMPGMMQMMQGMMGMMHQQTQTEQMQPGRMQPKQDCPMMPGAARSAKDATTTQAMMQMMQGMMQMMQAQMQSGQVQPRPQ